MNFQQRTMSRSTDGKEVRAFLGVFQDLYRQHRHGAHYLVRRPKDPMLVKLLLQEFPPERLQQMAEELLTTADEWIGRTDRGVGILVVKASWLDGVLCERAARRVKADWWEECKRLHQSECGGRSAHDTRMYLDAAKAESA